MIYLTVGTQLTFDRLATPVIKWAKEEAIHLVCQLGPTMLTSDRNITIHDFLSLDVSNEMFSKADLIISHAGMGSILTALELGKPILIFPRRHEFGEHRNDHQLATAKRFESYDGVYVAYDEFVLIDYLKKYQELKNKTTIAKFANSEFLNNLSHLINNS